MELNIDTTKIKENGKLLNKYIKEYEENNNDIFFELSKLDSYWKGIDSNEYLDKINIQKKDNTLVLNNLEELNDFYEEIYKYYDKFKNDEK